MKRITTFLMAAFIMVAFSVNLMGQERFSSYNERFFDDSKLVNFDQESREDVAGVTRPVYQYTIENFNLMMDVDKKAGIVDETFEFPNNFAFTQLFYYFTPDFTTTDPVTEEVTFVPKEDLSHYVDLSVHPYATLKVKASEATDLRFRLFTAGGTHTGNGFIPASLREVSVPGDEWVVIHLDYSDAFDMYVNSEVEYTPDASSIYRMGILVGYNDNAGVGANLFQGTVEVEYLRFGKAAAPRARLASYKENFSDFDATNTNKIWSETRTVGEDQIAPYTFTVEDDALKVAVDKNFTPTSGNNNFVSFRYNISTDSMTVADLNEYPFVSFRVKASENVPFRIQLFEPYGNFNDAGALNQLAQNYEGADGATTEWKTYTLDLTGKFVDTRNGGITVEDQLVYQFLMVPNPGAGGATWAGDFWVDDIKLGKAAAPKTLINSYTEDFTDFTINPLKVWSETRTVGEDQVAPYTFTVEDGALKVDVDKNFTPTSGNNNFVSFRYNISLDSMTVVDMNDYPYMSFKVKASEAIPYRVQLFEPNGIVNEGGAMNRAALNTDIPVADEWVEVFVDLTDQFIHVTNSNLDTVYIEDHLVYQFLMVPNFGSEGATWVGQVWVDDIKLGQAAAPTSSSKSALASISIDDAVIYPNPATSVINVKANEAIRSITVLSLEGKALLIQKSSADQISVDGLAQGRYILRVEFENAGVAHKSFIKQ